MVNATHPRLAISVLNATTRRLRLWLRLWRLHQSLHSAAAARQHRCQLRRHAPRSRT
jgi:hypothetical protein